MKKTKKNIATMAIIGGLVVTGCFGNVSADIASNSSIGEVRILTGRRKRLQLFPQLQNLQMVFQLMLR